MSVNVTGPGSVTLVAGVPTRPVADLVPSARNARTHSPEQVAALAASMVEFGFNAPVLIDATGTIVAGHGRVLAAELLGLPSVPVVVLDHLTETQRRAYLLADNRLAELAGWDKDLLAAELADLAQLGQHLETIGFTQADLDAMTAPVTDPFAEWQGMPEFEQAKKQAYQTIAVHLATPEDAAAFAQLVGQEITPRTRWLWHPAQARYQGDKQYRTDE